MKPPEGARQLEQNNSSLIVSKEDSIIHVLKKMDVSGRRVLIVMDKNRFKCVISIGDIQRAIIRNVDLSSPILQILREEVTYATVNDDLNQVKQRMKELRIELMPVVSDAGRLVNVIFWEDLFKEELLSKAKVDLNLPVIIMAGGEGSRLKPLTNVLPKPLIPIHNKTIIEEIMDRFVNCGCSDFYISLNYKAQIIRYYLDSLRNPAYRIDYFQEDRPLGTAGSLHLLKNIIHTTFFVSNCDILIEQDYSEIMNYHRENKNEITVVGALKSYSIPYGTITTCEHGLLQSIQEKPDLIFKINTGFYVLEPHVINEIPDNEVYHITHLMRKLQKENRRVGVFPVSEKSWIDIGNWGEYLSHARVNQDK